MAGERSQSCLMGTAVKEGVNLMKEGNEEREFQVEGLLQNCREWEAVE